MPRDIPIQAGAPAAPTTILGTSAQRFDPHATAPIVLAAHSLLVQLEARLNAEARLHLRPEIWALNAALVRAGAAPVHFSEADAAAFGHWRTSWRAFMAHAAQGEGVEA